MKKVLSIAGSDCSGGAGIQADLKTFSAHGVFGMSVIVSVVAENTSRVMDIQNIRPDMIEKQIDAVFQDIGADAVKIGMLSSVECMAAVVRKLEQYKPRHIVADPVMYAKNGCPLMDTEAVETLIKTVIPVSHICTPNIPEAEKISGMKITSVKEMREAARKIYDMGCKAVVIKGGHAAGNALDILFDGKGFYDYESVRINTKNTHGTGCTFSSAIASQLAKGMNVPEAVGAAKAYVTTAIAHSLSIGKGNGPTHHFWDLYRQGLNGTEKEEKKQPQKNYDYSLYLVTNRMRMSTKTLEEAVEKAVLGGCTMVQLRESDISSLELLKLAERIKKITDEYGVLLIINNRIDIALSVKAAGVHLGQEDIPAATARKIIGEDMLLGISVSSLQEAVQAQKDGADYLGVGAMFPSETKGDAKLVSINELEKIRQAVTLPVVVIGGINKENAAMFRDMGVDGLAVVSAIIHKENISQAAAELKGIFRGMKIE